MRSGEVVCELLLLLLLVPTYYYVRVKNVIKRCESKAPFPLFSLLVRVSMNFVNVRQSCGIVLFLAYEKIAAQSKLCARENANVVPRITVKCSKVKS